MAVSYKLAGVFSLSLRWMLVAIYVCHAEAILEPHCTGMERMNLL